MIDVKLVKVGMADLNVTNDPNGILKTTGLGSCVGVTLYDPIAKISGMAHVMLPSSTIAKEGQINMAKYADTAIPELIERMSRMRASIPRMVAKLAGGAQMFAFTGNNEALRIGPRNVESCKEVLKRYSIRIAAEDTGANYGRTIELFNSTGVLLIHSVQHGIKEL